MLKNEQYIYECDNYKIVNPNEGLQNEILDELKKYTDDKDVVDIENSELLLYLLKRLIESENEDYQFYQYNKESFQELEDNPPQEYKTIVYFLGSIMSDIIIEAYRIKILEIKKAHISLLQQQTVQEVVKLEASLRVITNEDRIIKEESANKLKINPIKKILYKLKKNKKEDI